MPTVPYTSGGGGGGGGTGPAGDDAFDYIQQAKPGIPIEDQTWRELDANGDVVDDWQYDGTRWRNMSIQTVSSTQALGLAQNFGPSITRFNSDSVFFESWQMSILPTVPAFDVSNFTTSTLRLTPPQQSTGTDLGSIVINNYVNANSNPYTVVLGILDSNVMRNTLSVEHVETGNPVVSIYTSYTVVYRRCKNA